MFCVLICGYRRSGKNTLADAICGIKGYRFNLYSRSHISLEPAPQVSFAAILKKDLAMLYGVSLEEIEKYKDVGPCYRRDLIKIAAARRAEDPRWFCRRLFENQSASCIITDWRYPNEHEEALAWCERRGAKLITIRVVNSTIEIPTEPSEHYLDDFPADILALPEFDILNEIVDRGLNMAKIGY